MRKKMVYLFILCFGISFTFAEVSQTVVQQVVDLKTILYQIQKQDDFLFYIEQFAKQTENMNLSEEENLYCQNIVLLEKANFVTTDEKELYYELLKQTDKNIDFLKKNTKTSKYFYVSVANLQSMLVNYLSGGEVYKISMSAKELYLKAIKLDKKFSEAHLGYSLWLFFAPSVAGGGFDAALKQINKAVKNADSVVGKYEALVYRSQIYFKLGNKNKWRRDLDDAKNILPNGNLHEYAETQNKKAKLLFD